MQLTRREVLVGTAAAGVVAGIATMPESAESKPGHVVLLGDSIFDNKPYVMPKPAVIDQLRKTLPAGWKATLVAVDGSVAGQIYLQLERLPADATHLIISTGGNDALQQQSILEKKITTVAEALGELSTMREKFDKTYARMLDAVLALKKPTVVCTIYNPNFTEARRQRVSMTALALFNDCILRAATRHQLPVLDLRQFFTNAADYANPIEPSTVGGQKIATHVSRIVQEHAFTTKDSVIFGA